MKIKLVKNYSTYTVGSVVDCDDATAKRLIEGGIAVRESQQDLIETATVEPEVEQADARPRRGRKKRAVPQPDDAGPAGG